MLITLKYAFSPVGMGERGGRKVSLYVGPQAPATPPSSFTPSYKKQLLECKMQSGGLRTRSARADSVSLSDSVSFSGMATRLLLDESMKRLESRADEMLNKLGRLDRMLDHVVDGSADCPRLFILTPATGSQTVCWRCCFLAIVLTRYVQRVTLLFPVLTVSK